MAIRQAKCAPIPDDQDQQVCVGMMVMVRCEIQNDAAGPEDWAGPGDEAQIVDVWVSDDGSLESLSLDFEDKEHIFVIIDPDKIALIGECIVEITSGAATASPVSGYEDALSKINAHRRKIGMKPLDPVAAGWTDDDVLLEAARIERNPALRGQLLSWA